jgi:hypothetical protein
MRPMKLETNGTCARESSSTPVRLAFLALVLGTGACAGELGDLSELEPSTEPACELEGTCDEASDTHQPESRPVLGTTFLSIDGEDMEVVYEEVAGQAIYQDDVILGAVDELGFQEKAATREGKDHLWDDAVIPYSLGDLPPNLRRLVLDAQEEWESRAGVNFVPYTDQKDFIEYELSDKNQSFVGRQHRGMGQKLYLAPDAGKRTALHELGHALGLWHEQARCDRNDYVKVIKKNVEPGKKHNFDRQCGLNTKKIGPYNLDSVMHYHSYAFSKNGEPTIVLARDGSLITRNDELSSGDVLAIKNIYGL